MGKKKMYEDCGNFGERRLLLLIKPYDSVMSRCYQEHALPAGLCGPPAFYKMEGVGFEPTQP